MSAVVIQEISASQYIGSPIVYAVHPSGAGAGGTFYRVKLRVTANLTGHSDTVFEFSSPCQGTTPVRFDISSALRACADPYTPTATPPSSYPAITFVLRACEEWMRDGVVYEDQNSATTSAVTTYMGKLTDRERLAGNASWPTRYSRKPASSPEICFHDYQVIVPGPTSAAPSVTLYLAGDPGEQDFGGLNYYVIPPPPDGHEIRFINSLGVHENVFVYGLSKNETDITTDQYVKSTQETLTDFSRRMAIKQNDFERWPLTSGPVDRKWESWYIHDFMMSRWHWIKIDGLWIPCSVIPEETTAFNDRITPARHEVIFKVRLDINGSPYL